MALSFMLLQETTLSRLSSFHESTKGSNPSIVSNEHPSKDRDITLLQIVAVENVLLSNPQQSSKTSSLTASHTKNKAPNLVYLSIDTSVNVILQG